MRAKIMYAALAVAIVAIGVGVPTWASAFGGKTKIVTKTVTKMRPAKFTGPQSLANFLRVNGTETSCPKTWTGSPSCYLFADEQVFVYLGVKQSGLAG